MKRFIAMILCVLMGMQPLFAYAADTAASGAAQPQAAQPSPTYTALSADEMQALQAKTAATPDLQAQVASGQGGQSSPTYTVLSADEMQALQGRTVAAPTLQKQAATGRGMSQSDRAALAIVLILVVVLVVVAIAAASSTSSGGYMAATAAH